MPGDWEQQAFVVSLSGAQSPEWRCYRASLLPRLLAGSFLWLQLLAAPGECPRTPSVLICLQSMVLQPHFFCLSRLPLPPASQSLVMAFRAHLESPG